MKMEFKFNCQIEFMWNPWRKLTFTDSPSATAMRNKIKHHRDIKLCT